MIFIPGNVSSSKNSKQWTGKYLVSSKQTQRYVKNTEWYWVQMRKDFRNMIKGLQKPLMIGFHFVRDSKRKYDYCNMLQICQDMMVKHQWIEDDNVDEMYPVPFKIDGKYSTVDKNKAGVYIKVLNND